ACALAASSTTTTGLNDCIVNCVTKAAASFGCSSYADLPCVCTSAGFQSASFQCLKTSCTTKDVATANQLQAQHC
ncbi:hypothetical protein BDN67DRAFT_868461, partial [Paxillus ammoniavirescens]